MADEEKEEPVQIPFWEWQLLRQRSPAGGQIGDPAGIIPGGMDPGGIIAAALAGGGGGPKEPPYVGQSMLSPETLAAMTGAGGTSGTWNPEQYIMSPEFDAALAMMLSGQAEPGSILDRMKTNVMSLVRGEIPQDVQDLILRARAEQNVSQGLFGPAAGFATARDIGKTSYDIQTQGYGAALQLDQANLAWQQLGLGFLQAQQNALNTRLTRQQSAADALIKMGSLSLQSAQAGENRMFSDIMATTRDVSLAWLG